VNVDEIVTLFVFLPLTLNFVLFLFCFLAYIVGAPKLVNTHLLAA